MPEAELTGTVYADIVKVVDAPDGSVMIVGKPASSMGNDIDGQVADPMWLRQALPQWMQWANIREMHQPSAAGVGESLEWDEDGEPLLTARVVDPVAKDKVRNKVYKGFSIGVKHPQIRPDRYAPGGRIVGGHIIEVSLVDRPAHTGTRFVLAKSANPWTWLDVQSGIVFELAEGMQMADVDLGKGVEEGNHGSSGDIHPSGTPFADLTGLTYNGQAVRVLEQDENRIVMEVDGRRLACNIAKDADGSWHLDGEPVEVSAQDHPDTENKAIQADTGALMPETYLMAEAELYKRDFSQDERDKAVKEGHALPNGSYPIYTCKDVKNARTLYQSGHGDVTAARRHTESWAKKLGCKQRQEKGGKMAATDTAEKAATVAGSPALDAALADRVWCDKCQLLVKMTVADTTALGSSGGMAMGHDEQGHELRKFVPPAGGDSSGQGDAGDSDEDEPEGAMSERPLGKAAGPHSDGDDCDADDADHDAWMDNMKRKAKKAAKKAAMAKDATDAGTGHPASDVPTEDVQAASKGRNEGGSGFTKDAGMASLVQTALANLLKEAGIDLGAVGTNLQTARVERFSAALDELKELAAEVSKDAGSNIGGPSNVRAPGEGGAAVRTQFVSVMNLVNQLAGQLAPGDGDFNLGLRTQPDQVDLGVADPIHTGRWDLTRSVDPDLVKSIPTPTDVTKVASQAAAGTVGAVMPDLVKSFAAQITDAFAPLIERLETVENAARPARGPLVVAERGHAFDSPDAAKAAQAETLVGQQLNDALAPLTDAQREQALAAVLSTLRSR